MPLRTCRAQQADKEPYISTSLHDTFNILTISQMDSRFDSYSNEARGNTRQMPVIRIGVGYPSARLRVTRTYQPIVSHAAASLSHEDPDIAGASTL